MKQGVFYSQNGKCEFAVWAPLLDNVVLEIVYPEKDSFKMQKDEHGYWKYITDGILPGARYFYNLGNLKKRPDPASHFQPEGVHSPSEIIDHNRFKWSDKKWNSMPLEKMIIYEMHVGTFTSRGTFEAVINKLNYIKKLGINTIEIMPVSQFPGKRNWGYDGVYLYAVQNSYGGPDGLKKLVDACHKKGIAVILDVVYNHLGPEGNYLSDYGPYFTDKYKTPWGSAINFDDAYCDGVRNFIIKNALYWFDNYHIDALRLDAVHGIYDFSAKHILAELSEKVEKFSKDNGRKYFLIAESDLNDPRIIKEKKIGGYGIDAQWCDEFHHSLHTVLTYENKGYYEDFGKISDLAKTLKDGFVYDGRYSLHRKRDFGSSFKDRKASRFVVFSQNHDQIGNRVFGERLSKLVNYEALKIAACTVIFSQYIPLLFMGEEYGEKAPFLFFVDHGDPDLIAAVREGRKNEFKSFTWNMDPPDPADEKTFILSKLNWQLRKKGNHKILLEFYKTLIQLRKKNLALSSLSKDNCKVSCMENKKIIVVERWEKKNRIVLIMNFGKLKQPLQFSFLKGKWEKILDSSDIKWGGLGASLPVNIEKKLDLEVMPFNCALYKSIGE